MLTIIRYVDQDDGTTVRSEHIPVPCACGGVYDCHPTLDRSVCDECGREEDGRRAMLYGRDVTPEEAAIAHEWREAEMRGQLLRFTDGWRMFE